MSIPINFLDPDSETTRDTLAKAIQTIPEGMQVVGLILKVLKTPEGEEKLVNYEFTDPDFVRGLALALKTETM
jgi:hypothetical protein